MLDNKGVYILWDSETFSLEDIVDEDVSELFPYELIDLKKERTPYVYSDHHQIVTFDDSNTSYVMVLVQGTLYNIISYRFFVDGPIKRAEPFCDPNAFYKMLVPVKNKH